MPSTAQERRKKSVSQTLIAQQSNVSIGTVSKALRGLPDVKRETSEKVHKIAKSLGYEFNGVEHLVKNTAQGFIVALINKSTYIASRSGYLEGLCGEAVIHNLSLVTHYVENTELDSVFLPDKLPWVMRQPELVHGIVLIHKWPESVVAKLAERWPCVSITHEYPAAKIDFVGVNASNGISRLMNKLHQKGHKKIGFFGHTSALSWSRARLTGYADTLFSLGLELNSKWIIEVEPVYAEQCNHKWDKWFDLIVELSEKEGVRAWMCASDLAGYELCKGLDQRGIHVPAQIAVTGFDSIPGMIISTRRLTSVQLQSQQMGAAAIRLLLARNSSPQLPRQVLKLDCNLVRFDCCWRETPVPSCRGRS